MCEKCQDKGFTEENHGLIIRLCDCEAGKEYRARMEAIVGIPKEVADDSGTGQLDTDTRSTNPSEPQQPKKRKTKKKAGKRSS